MMNDGNDNELIKSKKTEDSLSLYQLIWVRQEDCNFWPGILLPASDWRDKWPSLKSCKSKSPYIVFWLAVNRVSYVLLSHLYDFCDDFQQLYSPLMKSDFYVSAVEEGIQLVQRCNSLKSTDLLVNWAETNIEQFKKTIIPKSEVAKLVDEQKLILADVSDLDRDDDAEPSSKRLKIAGRKKQKMVLSTDDSKQSTLCPLCKKVFRKRCVQEHLDTIHYGWRLRCCICKSVLSCRSAMYGHWRSFHSETKFKESYEEIQIDSKILVVLKNEKDKRMKYLHNTVKLEDVNGNSELNEDSQISVNLSGRMGTQSGVMENVFDSFKCSSSVTDFIKDEPNFEEWHNSSAVDLKN